MFYGRGEDDYVFAEFFRSLWHSPGGAVDCPVDGSNVLPMIHRDDFVNYILDLCFYRPSNEHLQGAIVVDDAHCTLFDCIQVSAVPASTVDNGVQRATSLLR